MSVQESCMICARRTIGSEIILDAPDGNTRRAQVEARFGPLEIKLIFTQDRCTVCIKRTIGSENHFGRTRWNSVVTWVMQNLTSFRLETVLALVQDRCMVCARHTIGLEIVLDVFDVTTR